MSYKVGDKVVYDYNNRESIEKVERITPTGRVVVKGKQFINGYNYSDKWCVASIHLATEEDIKRIRENNYKNNIIYELYHTNWNAVTYEQAVKLKKVLDEIKR